MSVQFDIVSAFPFDLLSSCRGIGGFQFSEVEQYVIKNILSDKPDRFMRIISINTICIMEFSIFVYTAICPSYKLLSMYSMLA